jgi:hypothetical protein
MLLGHDRGMMIVRLLGKVFSLSLLAICATTAMGDGDTYSGQALIQVNFDRLVPITYPLATVQFDGLTPSSCPVIYPGIARVHITEDLVQPMDLALLRSN